jgi:ubiquitin C-terminal hydrolase
LNLKRFNSDGTKISHRARFELELDLAQYTKQPNVPAIYKLAAVVVHVVPAGTVATMRSGHYYTFAKSAEKWHWYNDRSVQEIGASKVLEQQAYIIVYVKA